MKLEPTITPINPDTFEYQTYSNSDENLIVQSELDTVFSASTDYIEYYIYDQNKDLIYPNQTVPLLDYDIREGDILLNPSSNLQSLGFDIGIYNISYSFYRKRVASSITEKYFISSISSDRTEIRLDSNTIENSDIISSVNDFVQYRELSEYFVDFYLNFGQNQTVIANNIKLETEEGIDPTILIKLYEPLPLEFNTKSELWIVELLSESQAYKIDFPFEPIIEDDFTYIAGPNYNLNIIGETASPGEQFSYNTLLNSDLTSSINQIQSLLKEKEINININYENFGNFVNFSSAKTRLENFFYKVDLIQSSSAQLTTISNEITSNTINTTAYSSSVASLEGNIDNIIKNFDGYEYFLYFNSGSSTSYPKSNTEPPFNLYPISSTEVQTWITASLALATDYDNNNRDWLYNSIPEYLRDDPANKNYELFVDMVGQYYDNVWTYTKDITNKFNADNRLDYGISKDLVSDAIKDFSIKLYSNNFNTDDLFTAFLGITPSGSAFPFPYMTGSVVDGSGNLDIPTGYEYVDTKISASDDIVPLDDVNKSVYKRIYHNIPYLLKTKGTIAGLRALITSYGIPDTILRINEFGGKDRNESQDYDLKQDIFNYAFDTGVNATNYLTSSLEANPRFSIQSGYEGYDNKARTIQLRFKPADIPLPINNVANSNIRYSQSIFSTDDSGGNLVLEYSGNGFVSESYSGSIPDPYDTYGTLKWVPAEGDNPNLNASIYLPFFNGDWWSVQINTNINTSSLYVANEIDGKVGFNESSSTNGYDSGLYFDATKGYLNKDIDVIFSNGTTYTPFSGSFQELRYYVQEISQSYFHDYVVNPYSSEGNSTHPTDIVGSSTIFSNDLPNQQFFRADLGTQLNTSSRTSIHPRVTGSAIQITQSFAVDSSFYINTPNFITNVEDIFQDQVPAGIKNRITDKVQTEKVILAEAPYGFPTPTSSTPIISSTDNDTQTLSPFKSMQELSFTSQSYTPNVDYLEVAFSPSNQINDDINAQLGYFNLGEFIGDPRFVSSSLYTYPDLDRLRNSYFEKYMDSYNVVDFVRLIKFFDNSLFKMIKDFTPARTSLSSGVVVKQHILERNRQRPAQASSSLHDYEGLVVNLPKDYSTGSTDFPQYSTEGSAIYKFSGGTGGSFERFNGEQTYGIPKFGNLLGRDSGISFSGTNLIPCIISNTINTPTGLNQSYFNKIADITKAFGYYPTNNDSNFSLGNVGLDIGVKTGRIFQITAFNSTPNNIFLSAGNQIKILGSDIDPTFTGEIVMQLTNTQITPNFNWSATIPYNRFGVTQSWQDENDGSILNSTNFNQSSSQFISGSYLGPRTFRKDNQSEFYDGIFSGSMIIATTQSLNPDCDPYLNANDTPVVYRPIFFSTDKFQQAVVSEDGFNSQLNVPPEGYAWISSKGTPQISGEPDAYQKVQSIKLSERDISGSEVINYLDDFDNLRIIFSEGSGNPSSLPYNSVAAEYIITGRTIYADHIILQVSQTEGNNIYQVVDSIPYYPITSSVDGGSMNWSLKARTNHITPFDGSGITSESIDTLQQGVFLNSNVSEQEQNFFYWDGQPPTQPGNMRFFNTGSSAVTTKLIYEFPTAPNGNTTATRFGAYTIPYTPNIPLYFTASLVFSASQNPNVTNISTAEDVYHSGSSYQFTGLTNQNFVLDNDNTLGFHINPQPYNNITDAVNASQPSSNDPIIYIETIEDYYPGYDPNFRPPILYSNAELTSTNTGLIYQKWYKVSNLISNSWFIILVTKYPDDGILRGSLSPVERNPAVPSTFAIEPASNLLIPPSKYFRPAPKSANDNNGLGTILFNSNYNTQIPGNSGSGLPVSTLGGHPKAKIGITSSMDWHFDSLELAGVQPIIEGGTSNPQFVPFSGSLALTGNSDFNIVSSSFGGVGNQDNVRFFNYTKAFDLDHPSMGEQYDGAVQVLWNGISGTPSVQGIAQVIHNDTGFYKYAENPTGNLTKIKVSAVIQATNSNVNFKVQLCEQEFTLPGNFAGIPDSFENIKVLDTIASVNDRVEFVENEYVIDTVKGLLNSDSPTSSIFFFRIQNEEQTDINYQFAITEFKLNVQYFEQINSQGLPTSYPDNDAFGELFRGSYGDPTNGYQFQTGNIAKGLGSVNFYNECVVNAYLKRTGSFGGVDYDYIITSSVYNPATGIGGYSGSIHSGSLIEFPDSPVLNISNDVSPASDTTSTRANPGDLYYVEYEFKDFKSGEVNGNPLGSQNIAFKSDDTYPKIIITSSGEGGSSDFGFTKTSVRVRQGNISPPQTGPGFLKLDAPFTVVSEGEVSRVEIDGIVGGNFNANDIFRWSVYVDKGNNIGSGLVITEFTASIFPADSIWSPLTNNVPAYNNYRAPVDVDFIIPTYYAGALPFNLARDCQPMLNNFILQRQSEYIMDVDYNNQSGSITPVNQEQILDNKAVKAAVPDSNYTALSSINPRYNGVKSTSAQINKWSIGDTGTYGKNPTVELRDAFFGYFNDLDDPYPNINGLTRVNLSYLIDEQGNALPPSIEPITIDTFNAVFPNTTVGKIAVRDISSKYQDLGAPSRISRTMEYVTPICYSQNSGNNYSGTIPLTGSGFVSRFDNDNPDSVTFAQFAAMGTCSINDGGVQDLQSCGYYLDPSEAITQPTIFPTLPATGFALPYKANNTDPTIPLSKRGVTSYPSNDNQPGDSPWNVGPGADLNNQQIVSVQTSIVTSAVSETKGYDELKISFKMYYGNIENSTTGEPGDMYSKPFNLEYIDCKVYTDTGKVYLIKNVDRYGWFKYRNRIDSEPKGPRFNPNLDKFTTTRINIGNNGLLFYVDWEMYETLYDLGLMREFKPKNGSGVIALEWIISANSGPQDIRAGNEINWRISGSFRDSRGGHRQGVFFPNAYNGAYSPTKISAAGVSDNLLASANQASAPFWIFKIGSGEFSTAPSILEMKDENFNEAYGSGFYQGDLPYQPGASEYFPGNIEPEGTAFDKIINPLEFEEGDEIRFGNNENFTYRIEEVFAPSENIFVDPDTGVHYPRVAIRLDRKVQKNVEKDFFLIRRKVVNPNSLYLETPFPYGTLSSGSISQVILNTGSSNFALKSSGTEQTGSFPLIDENGNYTGSLSTLELATTPGILFPDFPTEYLTKSASVIVNDLISRGIIES